MLDNIKNIVFETDYQSVIPNWWYINIPTQQTQWNIENKNIDKQKKQWFLEKFFSTLFPSTKWKSKKWNKTIKTEEENPILKDKDLKEQITKILEMPDEEYSDKKLTSKLRQYINEVNNHHLKLISDFKSHMAPSYREFKWMIFNISWMYWKTYYVQSYPSYIEELRIKNIMSFHDKRDMSFFIYPEDDSSIQSMLKQKATQLKAEINNAIQKWLTLDTELEQQYKDVEMIRKKITTKEERYFELGFYMWIYNDNEEKLKEESQKLEQKIAWFWIRFKPTTQRMDDWFNSILPLCTDDLWISRSAVSTSLAWSFPFISNDMVAETGILYWYNLHTWWLVIFNRFNSDLPNMNSVILATSWAWKSFTVKLEVLRYLLNWIDVVVIDPENEYKDLAEKVWWTYINVSTSSQQHINPFDVPPKIDDIEYWKWDLLRSQIMNLIWLIELLIGDITPEEEALLDKALQSTYSLKWFSMQDISYEWKQPPIMLDLLNVLEWMNWWEKLWLRLSKFVTWTFWKLFNSYTNVDINNSMTVFSIRDLEEVLKTPAMFNVLNFIRTMVKSHKKQRLLVCDEAWILLQHETSANFLFWLTKRARKYWLWITTISQDIEDFVKSKYWKPIISNSAFQILLKQSTTSIKSLKDLFWLSEAEQKRLVSSWVWEWLIFAGPSHIAVKILASPTEKEFITTNVNLTN